MGSQPPGVGGEAIQSSVALICVALALVVVLLKWGYLGRDGADRRGRPRWNMVQPMCRGGPKRV